ncbi:hypothetical protein D9M72_516120 [compost metagenome]
MLRHLGHQHGQPDDAARHVQPVGADEREERGQERTALRPCALMDQVRELIKLDRQEPRAEDPRDGQPDLGAGDAVLLHLQHGKAVGDRRQQQERGVQRHQRQLEQLCPARSPRILPAQHAIRGEQAREYQAVAHQVEPEPEQRPVLRVMVFGQVELVAARRGRVRGGGAAHMVGKGRVSHGLPSVVCAPPRSGPPDRPGGNSRAGS